MARDESLAPRDGHDDAYIRKKPAGRLPQNSWSNAVGYACNKDPRVNGNVGTKIDVNVDEIIRSELYKLDDGEQKVEVEPETREHIPSPPKPPTTAPY